MKPKQWILDHEAYTQICETRRTLLAHLRDEPDDFKALCMADVVAELDPEKDPALREHARRAHALRARLGAAWSERAREHGMDILLFNLCEGMQRAEIGRSALPTLARRAAEVTSNPRILALLREHMRELDERTTIAAIDAAIAARAPRLASGMIEAAFLPEPLVSNPRVAVRFHRSGHLAAVRITGDRRQTGMLVLEQRPGSGHLAYTARMAGHGYVVDEHYRDGAIHSTYCSPWHDGVESSEQMPWTRWVAEALASLEGIVPSKPAARPPRRASL
jgi:hypothetical protein